MKTLGRRNKTNLDFRWLFCYRNDLCSFSRLFYDMTFRLLLTSFWPFRISKGTLTPSSKEMTFYSAVATRIPNSFLVDRQNFSRIFALLRSVGQEFRNFQFEKLSAEMSTFDDDEEDVPFLYCLSCSS